MQKAGLVTVWRDVCVIVLTTWNDMDSLETTESEAIEGVFKVVTTAKVSLNVDILCDVIRAGGMTPANMEDVVYAMHSAYMDFHEHIARWMPTSLEDMADVMVVARKNAEPEFGDDPEEHPLGEKERFED